MDLIQHIFAFDPHSPLLFTQFYFWVFFAIVYALFACLHSKRLLRNAFLFFVSLFFYYKTSGLSLLILLFVTCSDFLLAQGIYRAKNKAKIGLARFWLVLSVIIDLGLLCYFKYAYFLLNFLNESFEVSLQVFDVFAWAGNTLTGGNHFAVDNIVLPVGISFYIFQVISYTADVYTGRVKPVKNILDFGFYVSFFPQLVAGPIVRASEFIPQLYKPFNLSRRQFGLAIFWVLNGLIKKIVLSDFIATQFIDKVFETPLLFSGFENLSALFFYSLQVYADFSGYTDIARGVALLMGFRLPQNFDSPYKSQNPQEFWHRWHMSLSRWLKQYLYIPLGGNRSVGWGTFILYAIVALVAFALTGSWWIMAIIISIVALIALSAYWLPSKRKKIYAHLNSFLTMLLGGLWHGASWNFVIWGGLNGVGMIINKWWRDMNWHFKVLTISIMGVVVFVLRIFSPTPLLNILTVCFVVVCAVTWIRYIFNMLCLIKPLRVLQTLKTVRAMGVIWAVMQTFTFITFTRLFFRSGSNLSPATANEEAWLTAQNMIHQIGEVWQINLIPEVIDQYWYVYVLFVLGMLIHWLPSKFKQWYRLCFASLHPVWLALFIVIAVFFVYQFTLSGQQAFIYFQF